MKKYFKLVLGSSLLLSGCTGTSPQLGVQTGMLKSCPDSPNCVNSQAKDEKHKIEPNDERLWFGQLYGMSDHISFNLAKEGYNTAKYVPFGPVGASWTFRYFCDL